MRVRLQTGVFLHLLRGFNSRTRVGATIFGSRLMVSEDVSIHAPVWVRHISIGALPEHKMFQFTHPCGCDLFRGQPRAVSDSFNSRTRVGATAWLQWDDSQAPVSIHAPVWVRLLKIALLYISFKFQFTHPCGCDSRGQVAFRPVHRFNSRTRVGATLRIRNLRLCHTVSIHAPVWVRRIPAYV